ncbi:unnamed protein product [Lathyrus oleraceus]
MYASIFPLCALLLLSSSILVHSDACCCFVMKNERWFLSSSGALCCAFRRVVMTSRDGGTRYILRQRRCGIRGYESNEIMMKPLFAPMRLASSRML